MANHGPARILLALVVVGCAESSKFTPGDSMFPTFDGGARVDAKKLDGVPQRGRVILFRAPEAPDREFVKRIIGVSGDRISQNGTEILVNGTPLPRCVVGPWHYPGSDGSLVTGELWLETLGGSSWLVFHDARMTSEPAGPWTVAPGEVFVLGDNREHSHDSRFWFSGKGGGVPLALVVGGVAPSTPALPPGAEPLAGALRACVAAAGSSPR